MLPECCKDRKNKIGIKNITTQDAAEGMTTAKTIHTEAGVSALTALAGAPTPLIVAVEDAAHPPRCCACRCGGCSASPPDAAVVAAEDPTAVWFHLVFL